MMMHGASDENLNDLTGYRYRLKRLKRYAMYHAEAYRNLSLDDGLVLTPYAEERLVMVTESLDRQQSLSQLFYEDCRDLIDGYISIASHRLNNIMKVLTIATVLFVPLGFMAGLYGMNFEYMPELGWRYGYFVLLGAMATVVTGLILWFRFKKWY